MTLYPTVTLQAAGIDTLLIGPDWGVIGIQLDIGYPQPRVVSSPAPDANGTDDTTRFHGESTITMQLHLFDDNDRVWELEQRLRAFMRPDLRPVMTIQRSPTAPVQQATLVPSTLSAVIGQFDSTRDQPVSLQWRNPRGVLESAVQHTATAYAAGDGSIAGLVAPVVAPWVLNAAPPNGSVEVVNSGTADAYPLLRLYGPCDGPSITLETTGDELAFDDSLTVSAGDFLEVNTREKTIRYNASAGDSRDTYLTVPEWWSIPPGVHRIRYQPSDFSAPSNALILWRDAWL